MTRRVRSCAPAGALRRRLLSLIHTSKVPNPILARVCGRLERAKSCCPSAQKRKSDSRFVWVELDDLERVLCHCFAAFDQLKLTLREADAKST